MSLENLKAQRQAILQKISKDPKNKKFHQHSLSAVEQQIREFELVAKKNVQSKGGTDDNALEAKIQQALKDDAHLGELEAQLAEEKKAISEWRGKVTKTVSENVKKIYEKKIKDAEETAAEVEVEIDCRRDEIIKAVNEAEEAEEVEVEEIAARTTSEIMSRQTGHSSTNKEELKEIIKAKQKQLDDTLEAIEVFGAESEESKALFKDIEIHKSQFEEYENELEALSKAPIPLGPSTQNWNQLILDFGDEMLAANNAANKPTQHKMQCIDFDIYKSVQQEKKLTEIYIGSTHFVWTFAIAKYLADCTEAILFTPFDRVICGLLSIDENLSFEEIATILGFNVIDNLENNQYKDIAENEILIEAFTSLFDYGMIEKGDNFFSRYRLTEIGREYAAGKKKFRMTKNKEFQLYFDLTTNNHDKAKDIFQDLQAQRVSFVDSNIDFKNEQFLKSFAESQIPEIYSSAQGNSFANTIYQDISFFNIELTVGILFDFQINTYRLKMFNKQTKAEYFTEYANANEELKAQILQNYFASLQPANQQKSELQNKFEERTCEIQNDADCLLSQNKPQEAVEKINQYYKETDIVETPKFWQNIDTFIDSSTTELFFNIPELTEMQYNAVQQFAKARPESRIFLAFKTTEIDIDKFAHNIYLNENSLFDKFSCFCSNLFVFDIQYLIYFRSRTFAINVITKKETENDIKIEQWKKVFAEKYIPIFLQEFQSFLQSDFEISLHNIEIVQDADHKVLYFENWFSDFGFDTHYSDLKQQQNEILEHLKQQHKYLLFGKIGRLSNETDIDSIEKLDQINEIKADIKTIENECISECKEVLDKVEKLKTELAEKELYIKDQLHAKHYIIDTNVFINCPEILSKIDIKHNVVLSAKVIDELDKLKHKLKGTEKENAEKALKLINQKLDKKKGNIRIARADLRLLPADFNDKSPDNLILCVAFKV